MDALGKQDGDNAENGGEPNFLFSLGWGHPLFMMVLHTVQCTVHRHHKNCLLLLNSFVQVPKQCGVDLD